VQRGHKTIRQDYVRAATGAGSNKHFSREPEVDCALRHPYKVMDTTRQRCFEDAALRARVVE